jgi:anti-sigma B factor antagonist
MEHVVILDVEGRLELGVEDRLKDKVNSLLLQHHRGILLNLKDVSRVDTSGLAALTAVRSAAERHGGTIKLLNLPARVQQLLVVTKLLTLFDVFESEHEAIDSFDERAAV